MLEGMYISVGKGRMYRETSLAMCKSNHSVEN